ncbi:MAG TPA: NFACT RNA binding domain-containing protein [Ignavibacteria bacterium]|nr:NFACT RNA binding domain-containing protein [Ignavibacteria bacterium]
MTDSYKNETEYLNNTISIFKNENNKNESTADLDVKGFYLIKDSTLKLSFIKNNSLVEEYENINELIYNFSIKNKKLERDDEIRKSLEDNLNKKIKSLKNKILNLETQLFKSKNSDELMQTGNFILANIHLIKPGDTQFSNGEKSVKLKTDLTPAENASKYFEKYKNLKKSSGLLSDKIRTAKNELDKLEKELSVLNDEFEILSKERFKKMEKENIRNNKQDETSKFRKFILNENYEVWVGKDSVSNDLLTMKYTHPEDLWFHVRGSSGSHTVLKRSNKNENPDKKFVEMAASIAAYYSKARNGKNIPVAYCEKKFIKKKKGFKSGSVLMEREKVLFVNPSIPE